MKILKTLSIILVMTLMLSACGVALKGSDYTAVEIVLDDEKITVDGKDADGNSDNAVYVANDIIYYESGKDFKYGEGDENDAHTAEEAAKHTVVHITKAGRYALSGKLSFGQIAIDLGKNASEDTEAVVTLILDGIDVTCTVAPAVIFYNVYECGSTDEEKATKDVDLTNAGANVLIPDGTVNTVNGSYVARIYKPESVQLSEDGTKVEDAKKLHKYDGAFYSKMSMSVGGGKKNTGVLNVNAKNEGLDSELHLGLYGGNININSGNDGINTNEDGISVTEVNGANLKICVTGETGEGDGIDSNGWLVINKGTVIAEACSKSADSGIDSDNGIYINGGTVIATGSMLDRIEDGGQTYSVFSFTEKQSKNAPIFLKDKDGNIVFSHTPNNDFSNIIFSSPDLKEGTYTLWSGENQLEGQKGNMQGGMGRPNMMPGGEKPDGEMPENFNPFENMTPPDLDNRPEMPEGVTPPDFEAGATMPNENKKPDGTTPPDFNGRPDGNKFNPNDNFGGASGEKSTEFEITKGSNSFSSVSAVSVK